MAPSPTRRARNTGPSCAKRPELPEEPEVVVDEQSEVIHAIAQHRESVDPGPEGVAGVALGVYPRGLQHVRVHHPAAGDLEPAGVLAHPAAPALAEGARHVDF